MNKLNAYYEVFLEEMKSKENIFKPVKADSEFDPEQLARGVEIEKEHTTDKDVAKIIAKHHLAEFSDYYIALDEMEKKLKQER